MVWLSEWISEVWERCSIARYLHIRFATKAFLTLITQTASVLITPRIPGCVCFEHPSLMTTTFNRSNAVQGVMKQLRVELQKRSPAIWSMTIAPLPYKLCLVFIIKTGDEGWGDDSWVDAVVDVTMTVTSQRWVSISEERDLTTE